MENLRLSLAALGQRRYLEGLDRKLLDMMGPVSFQRSFYNKICYCILQISQSFELIYPNSLKIRVHQQYIRHKLHMIKMQPKFDILTLFKTLEA